ncbi:unnamed protein product [Orchesella dallaii]|uniref:EF-hand domain-containing protein n=1 Tax=Orchesella dallaii TaxID=48710 RepID=A0ABP1R8S7_9HEXA
MRWDFFRYLLDIQGLTMAGSKDGGGHEISGHKDKDKSQPQLLSSRNLHHHHHHQQQQHIVSTPSPSSTNNSHHHHHHHHEEVVGDKKSPHSHSTLPSSDKSISLSSSLPTKTATTATNPGDTNSPSLTNDNDNDTIAILDDDDTIINHNVQEKKTIILSPSLWHNKNYTVINYKGNKATPNQSPIPPPSNLIRKDNDKNCNNTLPSTNYDCLKTVTVNINYNRNNSETNHNQGPPRAENNLSSTGAICLANVNNPGPSPKINGNSIIIAPHFKNNGHHYQPEKSALSHQNHYNEQSFSSSTDSNKAEANNRNGFLQQGGLEQGQVDDGPATEDEASSIASSDHNNVSGSGNSSSSGDIISNSAENHQTPSALLISSVPVVVPPTYRSLRWTRAVANQEWSHSLPRTQQILRPIILVGDGCRNTCDYDVESCRTHSPSGIKRREGGCGGGGEGVVKTKRNENDTNITTICAVVGDKNTKIVDVSTSTAPLTRKKTSTTINSPNTTNTTTLSTIRKIGSSGNEPRLLLPAHLQRPTSSIIGGNTTGPVAIATTSASGMSGVSVASCGANNTLFLYQDKWRVLFDKFDREGFGEITWTDFLLALRSKEFQLAVEPGKLQLLEDLARVHSAQTNAITFQLFVNIVKIRAKLPFLPLSSKPQSSVDFWHLKLSQAVALSSLSITV